ncbi:pyrimidine dimer DNA glycosylase/endonuclease V, partial [Candidatus Woesearchaeota archaeon]|nr:pyrimidine dimer DNA glycosylase/endonuclease V [Candidatus Woesearchaeota archaeon]
MVRVNIINPKRLADQHLIAEYNEILMLIAHARKHPKLNDIPSDYCLGKGHIRFFKNKLLYLKKRHELLKKEMRKRGFKAEKTVKLNFNKELLNDWKPKKEDKACIKKRLIW